MKTIRFFHWLPRIICILAILFIELFAMDSFSPSLTLPQQLFAFMMHSIPAIILTLFLLTAWRWELIGGIMFVILGAGFTPYIFAMNYTMNHSVWISLEVIALITFPFIACGVFFILSHFLKKRIPGGKED